MRLPRPLLADEGDAAATDEWLPTYAVGLACVGGRPTGRPGGGVEGKVPGMLGGGEAEEKASEERGDFCRWTGLRVGVWGGGRRSFAGVGGGIPRGPVGARGELLEMPGRLEIPGILGRGVRIVLSVDERLSVE